MSNSNERTTEKGDAEFSELLKSAGRGPRLSPEARQRIRARVESAWQNAVPAASEAIAPRSSVSPGSRTRSAETSSSMAPDHRSTRERSDPSRGRARFGRRRRHSRWLLPAVAAAAAVFAAVVLIRPTNQPALPARDAFAQLIVADGRIDIERGGNILSAESGIALQAGDRLTTSASGQLALALASGAQLRVNARTTIDISATDSVHLLAGMVYFDAPPALDAAPFTVTTNFGDVTHIGTQYAAIVDQSGLAVRVREGRTAIRATSAAIDDTDIIADAGQQVQLDSNGSSTLTPFAVDHPDWSWTESLARTPFEGETTVLDLLQWAARATGRNLQWATSAAMDRAQIVTLNQTVGLTPAQVVEVLNSTTTIEVSESEGTLIVSLR